MTKVLRHVTAISVLFFGLFLDLAAAPITIQGKAEEYRSETMVFYAYSNMVTFTEMELGTCHINDSGDFRCIIELDETKLVYTRLGVYNCYFFAEPGMIYEVRLPPRQEMLLKPR